MPTKPQPQPAAKPASPAHTSTPASANGVPHALGQSPESLTPRQILQLQRTIGNRAVARLLNQKTTSGLSQPPLPSPTVPLQRTVGLEIEHSVPVYKNLSGKSQEESLRQGSYPYDNSQTIYTAGDDIGVKADHSHYSYWLKNFLEENNPRQYENVMPESGVSIVEYNTKAPGLDELASGARQTFVKHTKNVENEMDKSRAGVTTSGYYVGVPPEPAGMKGASYDYTWLQVTVGVFPSKIDALHRIAVDRGNVRGGHLELDTYISGLVDTFAPGMYENLLEATQPKTDFWKEARDKEGSGFAVYIKDTIEPFQSILHGFVKSLLRLCLSYYLGSRLQLPEGWVDKNAVPLLSRQFLGNVFTAVGGTAEIWERLQEVMVSKILPSLTDTIDPKVQGVISYAQLQAEADPYVLDTSDGFVGFMMKVLTGEGFYHTAPDEPLEAHDPLAMKEDEASTRQRPERGGAQFEYRSPAQNNWQETFIGMGQDAFRLNTEHLSPEERKEAAKRTGWKLDDA